MSFLYTRKIEIRRPSSVTGAGGGHGYVAETSTKETVLVSGVKANIQAERVGSHNSTGLPTDSRGLVTWRVLTPRKAVADGFVKNRDIFVDDLGRRFQVIAAYTNALGGSFLVEQMEA